MSKFFILSSVFLLVCSAQASWYWPFGSSEGTNRVQRLSELMEPATVLIDEASDLASEGKIDESVEKYRLALAELDRIEGENAERAKTPEFSTLRNKRAYVNAAIDSMLLTQIKSNERAVAVSDTAELEKKLAAERAEKRGEKKPVEVPKKTELAQPAQPAKPSQPSQPTQPSRPRSKRDQVMVDIANGDYAAAEILIKEMLQEKPNGAMALNLKASLEMKQGKVKEAEATLDRAIMSNPRNYFAYYNMAILRLQIDPGNKNVPRSYYETGRAMGGPVNPQLEELVK